MSAIEIHDVLNHEPRQGGCTQKNIFRCRQPGARLPTRPRLPACRNLRWPMRRHSVVQPLKILLHAVFRELRVAPVVVDKGGERLLRQCNIYLGPRRWIREIESELFQLLLEVRYARRNVRWEVADDIFNVCGTYCALLASTASTSTRSRRR